MNELPEQRARSLLQRRKAVVEAVITKALSDFSKETGLVVDYVNIDPVRSLDGGVQYVVTVDVKL